MRILPLLALLFTTSAHAQPVSLFDGKTLEGWDFDPAMWRVEDGVITGIGHTHPAPDAVLSAGGLTVMAAAGATVVARRRATQS